MQPYKTGLPRVTLLVALAILVMLATTMALQPGGRNATALTADIVQLVTQAGMAITGVLAGIRLRGRLRTGLLLVGLAGATWFVGQSLWVAMTYSGVALPSILVDWVMPIAYLVGTPMLVAAAVFLFGDGLSAHGRGRRLLDSMLIVASSLAILWVTYLGSAFTSLPTRDPISLAYLLVYPIGDAIILGVIASMYLRLPTPSLRSLLPAALAFVCIAAADTVYAFIQSSGYYDATSWFVLGWVAAELLFMTLAVRLLCGTRIPSADTSVVAARGARAVLVVPAIACIVILFAHRNEGFVDMMSFALAAVVLMAVLGRHWLHVGELRQHAQLLERSIRADVVIGEQRATMEGMKQADDFKTQLLNMTAHELNTPIAAIQLQLRAMKMKAPLSPELTKGMQLLDRNVGRLAGLVADTLDVARLESGRLDIKAEPARIAPLVQEALLTFAELLKERRILVAVDIPEAMEAQVDASRFTQVVYNLVSNAVKFTPVGGEVRITARQDAGSVLLEVVDNGLGMTADQLARLFKPFSQVHGKEAQVKGTGLGLFISRGIVEQHGGKVTAASPGPGRGSRFTIRLPGSGVVSS